MISYSSIYLLFISIVFYLFIIKDLIYWGPNSRLNDLYNKPFEELFFFIGFLLVIFYPLTVILSLFSIFKKLTNIEKIIKDDYEKKLKELAYEGETIYASKKIK